MHIGPGGIYSTGMFQRYEPRSLAHLGNQQVAGYWLKTYAIVYGDGPMESDKFEPAWRFAEAGLPQPAVANGRPGVGFAIMHQGRTADYFILCWWDNENELPIRVFVRDGQGWRPAAGSESICVWDLRVIWWEREAYVNSVLAGLTDDAYLLATMQGFA